MALIDVLKWDDTKGGDSKDLIWKHPNSELSTKTQLIVNESQEALFFKDGKRCDTFGAGRHTLSTNNLPLLNKLVNLPFGGDSPFAAEVWFVNKAIPLDVKWGTTDPIQLEDPQYQVVIPVRAFGQFGLQIADSGVFVTKLVGVAKSFSQAMLQNHFKGILLTQLKTAIAQAMVKRKIGILEITTELMALSEQAEADLNPSFEKYGVRLESFRIMSINVPEDDESYKMLKEAKANAARRRIEGISYQQERSFDVMEGAATNEGGAAGAMMSAGLGLGMGMGAGGMAGQMMGQQMGTAPPAPAAGPPANPFAQPPATGVQFHVHLNGQQMGPYGLDILKQGVDSGQFTKETSVWRDGMAQWMPAGQVPELQQLFGPAAPPPFGGGGGSGGPPPFGG